jgi:GNAT superfamily N-acetyltransferase
MLPRRAASGLVITPYVPPDWADLWTIRFAQLQDAGVVIPTPTAPDPAQPVDAGAPEWDFHHIQQVYLSGRGNFWLARVWGQPIGYVGAQDIGGVIELRRMYVQAAYRRQGVGTALVRTLVDYSAAQGAAAIELWTHADGAGLRLYGTLGFHCVVGPGAEFADVRTRTRYAPQAGEVRMRLDLHHGTLATGSSQT